nr:hypothetical protein [uncultured Reyranella sp.]
MNDHISGVDADSKDQSLICRALRFSSHHRLLKLDRGGQRFDGACELHQRPIAGQLDNAPASPGDDGFEQFGSGGSEAPDCPALIPADKS